MSDINDLAQIQPSSFNQTHHEHHRENLHQNRPSQRSDPHELRSSAHANPFR